MEWIKKIPNWGKVVLNVLLWVFITFVVICIIPYIINYLILKQARFDIVGDGTHWLSFWASYLAAIASFVMIFFTWRTLKEMQRQWKEQNTPIVSCSLEKSSESLLVELYNTSQVPAHKIRVRIDNNTGKDIYRFDKTCELLEKMTFEIPPFSIKQIPIILTPYVDGEYEGYLSVELSYCGKQERFDLYLKEINLTTWKYSTKDVCSKIEHLDNTVKSKNFMQ